MRKIAALVAASALVLFAAAGFCADPPKKGAAKADAKADAKAEDKEPANVRMGDVEIRGEYENPDVFYIIPRRKAEMDTGSLTMDYTSEIMKPVIPHVFEARHAKDGAAQEAGSK